MLQPVGIFAITPILGAARRLYIRRTPRLRPQRAQGGGRMERPGADFHIVRLQNHAALIGPELVQVEDELLEGEGHGWPSRLMRAQS